LMRDAGIVTSDEPFKKLLTQGMVLKDGTKMSKSKGNTVDPLPLIEKYGADTVRMFTMFASPPDQSLEWSDSGVEGSYRFLKRLWKIVADHDVVSIANISKAELSPDQRKLRLKSHQSLEKISDDYGRRNTFNTAIAATMELLNATTKFIDAQSVPLSPHDKIVVQESLEIIIAVMAPIVPHFSHVLWQHLGHSGAVIDATWPVVDPTALAQDSILVVVQVNGKLRAKLEVAKDLPKQELEALALEDETVKRFTDAGTIRKVIVVPGKLVNIVVN
jgi:leucyl-tRNA synthetase